MGGIPEEIKAHLPGCGGHEGGAPQTSWCQQMPAELRAHFDFCKDADAAEATTTAAAATTAAAQGPQWCQMIPDQIRAQIPGCSGDGHASGADGAAGSTSWCNG